MHFYLLILLLLKETTGLVRLAGPGNGWNYLKNEERLSPFNKTYIKNHTTNDFKYQVQDYVTVFDRKTVRYTDTATIIHSGLVFRSLQGNSLELGFKVSYGKIGFGGSLSNEWTNMNFKQNNYESVTLRSSYINTEYDITMEPSCPLNADFLQRIKLIYTYLKKNDTTQIQSLIDQLISYYGTHYITDVSIGGMLYIETFNSERYWQAQTKDESKIKYGLNIEFAKIVSFNFGTSHSLSTEDQQLFNKSLKSIEVNAIGGKYVVGQSLATWSNTLKNNLVVIDRKISPLPNLITSTTFPDLKTSELSQLTKVINDGIITYLKKYNIVGCMNRTSDTYDSTANVHNETLCKYIKPKPFGGIFAIMSNRYYKNGKYFWDPMPQASPYSICALNNFMTGQQSCANGYLVEKVIENILENDIQKTLIKFYECISSNDSAVEQVYFGGIYTNSTLNNVTQAKSCPSYFVQEPLLVHSSGGDNPLCNVGIICLSRDKVRGPKLGVDFGGFITSNKNYNPWSSNTECATGFSKSFAFEINKIKFYYCARL